MAIVAKLRSTILKSEINKLSNFYEAEISEHERLRIQLELFNSNWKKIIKNVPYYRSLYLKGALPIKFESWNQFIKEMPVGNRLDYIRNQKQLTDQSKKVDYMRITGGSSGNPLQIPAWKSEDLYTRPDQWVGRRWYGIKPEDRCLWLTGNSYLLGSGLKGNIKKYKRAIKDALLGYYRLLAYNLNTDNIRKMTEVIINQRPDYIIGFSGVLDLFARVNQDRKYDLAKLNLKAIIATSEIFPFEDSAQIIAETFNTNVAMEYGSNETIAIAHTEPNGNFKVFWKNYFIEGVDSGLGSQKEIRVTSLYPRCFPLIRYELGDQIELIDSNKKSDFGIEYFRKVYGRKNNYVLCENGEKIHTSAFSLSLRIFPEITAYQIINEGSKIELHIVIIDSNLSSDIILKIRHHLSLIHPELSKVIIRKVDQVERTVNGKSPLLIRK